MNTKQCSRCGKELPLSKFWKKTRSKDGLFSICIECYNAHYYSKENNTMHHRKYRQCKKYTAWGGVILRDKSCKQCSKFKKTCPIDFDLITTDLGQTCKSFSS